MDNEVKTIEELSRERIRYIINEYCAGSRMEFCKRTGIGKSSVSQYINGTNAPGNITASKIGEVFHLNPMWIMGFDAPMRYSDPPKIELLQTLMATAEDNGLIHAKEILEQFKPRQIPVYGRVAAGIPIEAVENIIDWEEIPADWKGEYGCLVIKGDSMSPRILDGDRVVVKIQDDAESGDIVIAIINGHDGVCKKLIKQTDGIVLQSLNPSYEPMYFSKESQGSVPVRIWGKVVELRGKF